MENKVPLFISRYISPSRGHWIWKGPLTKDNHPQVHNPETKKTMKVRPFLIKQILKESVWNGKGRIRILCDESLCINPKHLLLSATRKPKFQGKYIPEPLFGESNGRAKLTEQDVLQIRELKVKGYPIRYLSRRYRVSENQIRRIVRKENWPHV